jgi:hypothetical protein
MWLHAEEQTDVEAMTINRALIARLERKDPDLAGDLGWITVDTAPLPIVRYDAGAHQVAWGATVVSDDPIPLQRPGPELSDWRVTVEEWERFPGDLDPFAPPAILQIPVWEQRLVFADEVHL